MKNDRFMLFLTIVLKYNFVKNYPDKKFKIY